MKKLTGTDKTGRNGSRVPAWIVKVGATKLGWADRAIGKKMGLLLWHGRECLSVYLVGITLVSLSRLFSIFLFLFSFVFLFSFFLIKFGFEFFFFFFKIYISWVNGSWYWRGQGKGCPSIYIYTENLPTNFLFLGHEGPSPLGPPPEWVCPYLNG